MTKQTSTPHFLQPHGNIPNNQQLPLLVYQQVFGQSDDLVNQFKETFKQNNWRGSWVNGVFDYHHYHSRSHEVLGVAAGSAVLILGGPAGKEVEVKAGDMLVLPAGTGHCLKSSASGFKVVGAYPVGQENYDICTEKDDPQEKKKSIAQVALPTSDPVFGADGPLLLHWKY
ncbi:cupin domain-containing protein [Pontibacter anaerobius]|uniref:Cupin domain-containing protein n=1 Tax=Pontibacter anaerobius TaxID=2993940 RepID=A0ABT3RET5_9BACT|nr:cupin domain-containing protein [Pontibacter anaerobius]MCX2739918.1 cupin domain-containing protein [Pontibacter anaerobius]